YSIGDTPGTAGVSGCMNLTNNNTVYIQTGNIVPSGTMASCINITASNVTFNGNGYWISNVTFNQSVIFSNNRQNITIRNANVSNNMGDGLTFSDVNYSLIINGTFDSNDDGIFILRSSNTTVINNIARNNTNDGFSTAIGNGTVINNTASFNFGFGVRIQGITNVNVTANFVSNNTLGGILLSGGGRHTVNFNTITNNSGNGLRLSTTGSGSNTIINNTITYNSISGIDIVSSSVGNTVDNNTISFNGEAGIFKSSSSSGAIYNFSFNVINFNKYGINLSLNGNSQIVNNVVNNNSHSGVITASNGGAVGVINIVNNSFNNNSIYGVFTIVRINITNNTIQLSTIGIYANSSNNIIGNNTIKDNSQYGIYLNYSLLNNITGNIFINNTIAAINLTNAQNNTIINNSGDGNTYGISFASGSSGNQIYNNIIRNSRKDAVFIADSASGNNSFANMSLLGTNNSFYDVRFASSGINNTFIIDTNISNYTFTGTGGIVIFRHSRFGQIEFLKNISGNSHNLSLDVQIRNNSIFVNGSKGALNQTANITLYGIKRDLINPRIIRAGETCTQAMGCYNFTALTAGTVSFNVTGWSNYSIGDLPVINFTAPTFANNTKITPTGGAQANISINSSGLSEFTWNWNGTNYTMYNDSLVLMMNFENLSDLGENQTFVRDNSRYGNNGTMVNGADYNLTNVKYGKAAEFNGVDDALIITDTTNSQLDFTGNMTMEAWVYRRGTPSSQARVVGKGDLYLLYTGTDNIMRCYSSGLNTTQILAITALPQNIWTHVACTFATGLRSLYIDGKLVSSDTPTGVFTVNNENLAIGNYIVPGAGYRFNGTIDEIKIWNRTLSADEINQTYYSGLYRLGNTSWEFYTNKTNLTRGSYTYQGIVKDGAGTQSQTEWRTLRVNNLPTATLVTPTIWNQTTNRTPSFTWTSNDADSDAITYELNLTCYVTTGGGCSGKGSDERYVQSIVGTTHNLAGDLQYLIDYNNYYNWSVRAYDGSEYGAWTNIFGLNISALVAISLPVSTIDFGLLTQGQSKNTTTGDPAPFRIQNDGNAFVNITVNGTNLWLTKANPDRFYQFKIANNSAENGSFSWSQSLISFRNMSGPAVTLLSIIELNYTDASDTALIDLLVEDPASEPAGQKLSTVTFTASLGE
ncbi:MAG: LamG-like jellyroll fold domain-containing protein, partial [Nanoarchaeota archaeon]